MLERLPNGVLHHLEGFMWAEDVERYGATSQLLRGRATSQRLWQQIYAREFSVVLNMRICLFPRPKNRKKEGEGRGEEEQDKKNNNNNNDNNNRAPQQGSRAQRSRKKRKEAKEKGKGRQAPPAGRHYSADDVAAFPRQAYIAKRRRHAARISLQLPPARTADTRLVRLLRWLWSWVR